MKNLLRLVGNELRPLGYQKLRSRFFRIDGGFCKQIDIQSGAHGRYFFVNVCLHPVGLPDLVAGNLVIPERPQEHECIIRRRLEDVVPDSSTQAFRIGLVSVDDEAAISGMLASLSSGVEAWLSQWCSFCTILSIPDLELQPLLSVVPALREKACNMLKLFCALNIHNTEEAQSQLSGFLAAPTCGYDFAKIDEYMQSQCDASAIARDG